MKKGNLKRRVMLLVAAVLMALTGCGKGGKEEEPAKEFVYVPSYINLDIDCDNVNQVAANGDILYMQGYSYDEAASTSTYLLYQYNILSEDLKEIPLQMDTEDSYMQSFAVDPDGKLRAIVNTTIYKDKIDYEIESESTEMWTIDPDSGSVLDKTDIKPLLGDEQTYIQYMAVDNQGNLYMADGNNTIHVVDKEYKKVCDVTTEDWINSMDVSSEGTVYVSYYGANGVEFRSIDLNAKAMGESLPGVEGYENTLRRGSSKSFLLTSGDTVSLYDAETGTKEELFNWLDADINSDNVVNAGELSDGRIWALTQDWGYNGDDNTQELVCLTKTKASEVPQKEEITFGTMWINSNVKRQIINFNKTNEKYRITVEEYGTDDYETGQTQFNATLTSGNCPDIIDLSSISYEMYAGKGVFEDLAPYMEKSGITSENYMENVLNAYNIDGKIYGITPQFYVTSMIVKTKNVGDAAGWTLGEMLDFTDKYEAEDIFSYGTQSSVMYSCVFNSLDEFVNWETGECSFNNEDFIRILNFIKKFPEEADYNDEEMNNFAKRIHDDKLVIMENSVSSVQEYQMMNGMFGEATTYIGYPDADRKGNMIVATGGSMAIASKSDHKDGAWDFIYSMINEEYQESLVSEHGGWGFPISKKALEKQFELDMTPDYWTDENGTKTENPKTTWGYGDFEMDIFAATQEEVDAVRTILESAEKLSGNTNQQISEIITEETAAFFKGQKTAEDVADVIENRVRIYVNENR